MSCNIQQKLRLSKLQITKVVIFVIDYISKQCFKRINSVNKDVPSILVYNYTV